MIDEALASRLADVVVRLVDLGGLDIVCDALNEGRLTARTVAVSRAAIACGNAALESCIRGLQEIWLLGEVSLTPQSLGVAIRLSAASIAAFRRQVPMTEVVWTGPKVDGSFLRSTREIVRDILRRSQRELLVVGYWIAAREDGDGIIEEFIASLADAVLRGVVVRIIVDHRVRADGWDNRRIITSSWPSSVPLPMLLTWRLPDGDDYLKLHAKALVADRRDALVTSANLTLYAMDRNMEIGVRIVGQPAGDIAKHFDLLIARGILEPYIEEQFTR